jgi:hypothetical protein
VFPPLLRLPIDLTWVAQDIAVGWVLLIRSLQTSRRHAATGDRQLAVHWPVLLKHEVRSRQIDWAVQLNRRLECCIGIHIYLDDRAVVGRGGIVFPVSSDMARSESAVAVPFAVSKTKTLSAPPVRASIAQG